MMKLEQKIGNLEGTWAIHRGGFHRYPALIQLDPTGRVKNSKYFKLWALSGSFLLLFDENMAVSMVFTYENHNNLTAVLKEQLVGKDRQPYFLRRCGAEHKITTFSPTMSSGDDIDFIQMLATKEDFSVEIRPAENVNVLVEEDLCINGTDLDIPNIKSRAYTAIPAYMRVLNNAKIISGFVVEQSDGRCLVETSNISDINTAFSPINCYFNLEKGIQYYPDVPAGDTILELSIYMENAAGYGHIFHQYLPSLYFLLWLMRRGVDLSRVKLLFRAGFHNPDIKPMLEACGLLEKMSDDCFVDLSKLSPVIAFKQLIVPSFFWIAKKAHLPEHYKFAEFAVSPVIADVFAEMKKNILSKSVQKTEIHKPYILIVRRAGTRRPRLVNEDELLQALEPLGFEGVDTAEMHYFDKARLFNNARIVIGAQGSGLAHASFCSPGSYILELLGSAVLHDVWCNVASIMKLKYACVVYPTEVREDDIHHINIDRCFRVNVAEVVDVVKKMLARVQQDKNHS